MAFAEPGRINALDVYQLWHVSLEAALTYVVIPPATESAYLWAQGQRLGGRLPSRNARVIVRVEPVDGAHPRQNGSLVRIRITRTSECRRRAVAPMRMVRMAAAVTDATYMCECKSTILRNPGLTLQAACYEESSPGRDPCAVGIDDNELLELVQCRLRDRAYGLDEALVQQDVADDDLPPVVAARPDCCVLGAQTLLRPSEQPMMCVRG
jgi:hypothetical protein